MMLEHLGKKDIAAKITKAILKTLENGSSLTKDLGGTATTKEFTAAIIANL